MDVKMEVTIGGGKGMNRTTHSKVLKDVTTWEETVEALEAELGGYFEHRMTLDEVKGKKQR